MQRLCYRSLQFYFPVSFSVEYSNSFSQKLPAIDSIFQLQPPLFVKLYVIFLRFFNLIASGIKSIILIVNIDLNPKSFRTLTNYCVPQNVTSIMVLIQSDFIYTFQAVYRKSNCHKLLWLLVKMSNSIPWQSY